MTFHSFLLIEFLHAITVDNTILTPISARNSVIKYDIFLQIKKGHLSKMMSIWECIHFFRWKINVNLFSRFISRPCNFRVKVFLSAQHFYFSVLSNDFKFCFQTSPKMQTLDTTSPSNNISGEKLVVSCAIDLYAIIIYGK